MDIYTLEQELKSLNGDLFGIEWNNPVNVARRESEAAAAAAEKQREELRERRTEHDRQYQYLDELIRYLTIAGLSDLARRLSNLRYAFHKPNGSYINDEVELIGDERAFLTKTVTTKREFKQIRKYVVRLSKDATKMAKKYKDLYQLYLRAREIVLDIKKKGIDIRDVATITDYFTQPTSFRFKGTSLGYPLVQFSREYDNQYHQDVIHHKI